MCLHPLTITSLHPRIFSPRNRLPMINVELVFCNKRPDLVRIVVRRVGYYSSLFASTEVFCQISTFLFMDLILYMQFISEFQFMFECYLKFGNIIGPAVRSFTFQKGIGPYLG